MWNEVAAAEFQPINTKLLGAEIQQALQHEHGFGAASTAERTGTTRICEHAAHAHRRVWDGVDTAQDPREIGDWHVAADSVRANVVDAIRGERLNAAVVVEPEAQRGDGVAALVISQKGLGPVA